MNMKNKAFHILRLGIAITFLWIGILILKAPEAWGSYLQPWAVGLLPIPLKEAMIATAFLDIIVGLFLLINVFIWLAALLGSLHLAIILITAGINAVTVRDIGLLGATLALMITAWPDNLYFWKKKPTPENF